VPLHTWETLLAFIRGTTTTAGLAVQAIFQPGDYPTGQKVSDAGMDALNIERHAACQTWNYTIRPRTPAPNSSDSGKFLFDETFVAGRPRNRCYIHPSFGGYMLMT